MVIRPTADKLIAPGDVGDRDYVDPLGGEALGGGLVRARRLAKSQAYRMYGQP